MVGLAVACSPRVFALPGIDLAASLFSMTGAAGFFLADGRRCGD